MGVFDNKHFDEELFVEALEKAPRVKQNALLRAGVLRTRSDLASAFEKTNYVTEVITGLLDGNPVNYDGNTDITATSLETYTRSLIAIGRAKAWTEKDFTADLTGKDYMQEIANQVSEYWDDVHQSTLLSILKGVFANDSLSSHVLKVDGEVDATTLNKAIQQASGANRGIYTAVIMHSAVATNLENKGLIEYAKYTDPQGIQADITLKTWNGRTVLEDDDVPFDSATGEYTTYILGRNAFDTVDAPVEHPSSTDRDEKANGGTEFLYTRDRKVYAPYGMSFVQPSSVILSPTDTQLETKARWAIAKSATGKELNNKAIPLACIVSKG